MAPLVIPEELLTTQTKDNKAEIIRLIKERILQNKKTNPKNLREGLPKPFLYGEEVFEIKNVSEFGRTGKKLQLGRQTNAKKIREALLRAMTDQTGAARKTAYGRGARKLFRNQEDHHIIFRTLIDNFYKNLPEDQAAELTAHLARRGSPVGNVIENLQGIDIDFHDSKDPSSIHQWARNMGIDSKSFPDLTNLDLDARTVAIDEWLDLIEQPLLDKTAETLAKQDLRRYPKGLPKGNFRDRPNSMTKEGWLEFLTNQRENVKARANLLDKYPILDIDLDSPDIRPELKARYQKALSLVPEEAKQQWKALSPRQALEAGEWLSDNELAREIKANKNKELITDTGRRLGGLDSKIKGKFNPVVEKATEFAKIVGRTPGVKPALEVLDTVRKNPVVATVSTLPVLSAFDIAEAADSGTKLVQNKWDTDAEIGKLEKQVEQARFLAGTSGVSSLTPAAPVMGPTSLVSGAVSLILENRLKRAKDKRDEMNILSSAPISVTANTPDGIAEIKQRKRNVFELTSDKYQEWLNK